MSSHDLTDEIRAGAEAVVEGNSHVQIEAAALARLAASLVEAPVPSWNDDLHYFDGTARTALYLLLLDATNFCFWPSRFIVEYRGRRYGDLDGYDALAVAWRRAFEGGVPVDDLRWLKDITEAEFRAALFCVEGEVPMLAERLQNVRALAGWLFDNYGGRVGGLLAASRGSAPTLVTARRLSGLP